MAYNKGLDKELFHATIEGEDEKALHVSVHAYNGGEPKLQIGPRTYIKRDGGTGYGKAGRISADEVAKLVDILKDVEDILGAYTVT